MSLSQRAHSDIFSDFQRAVHYGDVEDVRAMIRARPELIDPEFLTTSPLSFALSSEGHTKGRSLIFVKMFLEESGATPAMIKNMMHDGASATHILRSALNHAPYVPEDAALLIMKHDMDIPVDEVTINHSTPMLMQALLKGYAAVARTLIDRGANIHAPSDWTDKRNVLHCAANGTPACVDAVIDLMRSDINTPDAHGLTPFLHAIKAGKLDTAMHLVALGADPHAVTEKKVNALMVHANTHVAPEITRYLINDIGIDPQACDDSGKTALHYLGMQPWMKPRNTKTAEILRILLDAGCAIDAPDSSGVTPLMIAAKEYDSPEYKVNSVKPLLKTGANPCIIDNNDNKASDHAKNDKVREMLLRVENLWVARIAREEKKRQSIIERDVNKIENGNSVPIAIRTRRIILRQR